MELLKLKQEFMKDAVRTLGLSDEFTIFSVWNMLTWENANEELFGLIRKVRGWGRIHILENLEPETPEIREWILFNGVDNDVKPVYSALTAWEKASVPARLQGALSQDEFDAVSRIIAALADEGPVPGISMLENAGEYIRKYLSIIDAFRLGLENYETLLRLQGWAADPEVNLPDIAEKCDEMLHSDSCRALVEEAVKAGRETDLAEALGIELPAEAHS